MTNRRPLPDETHSNQSLLRPFSRRIVRTVPTILLVLLAACASQAPKDSLPAILAGLPRCGPEVQPSFDRRIKQRFPVGSDESLLTSRLTSEEFKGWQTTAVAQPDVPRTAVYKFREDNCQHTYGIQWKADGGKITAIEGGARAICRIDIVSNVPLTPANAEKELKRQGLTPKCTNR